MKMADLQTAEILRRLKNLEQQNLRYRLFGLGITVFVLAGFLMGQSKPNVAGVVEAQSFVLRDRSGKLRGTLAVDSKTDASTLVLADQSGKIRAEFKVANDGNAGIGIGLDPDELPAIVMYDDKRNIVWRATGRNP
jgi:hypothetical protein